MWNSEEIDVYWNKKRVDILSTQKSLNTLWGIYNTNNRVIHHGIFKLFVIALMWEHHP